MTDEPNSDPKPPQKLEGQQSSEGEKGSSAIEPEVLDKLPPELKKAVESFSLQAFTGPVFHPILKKVTESHIDKVLDQTEKDSERDFEDAKSSRRYGFAAFVIICALFVFLTWYLTAVDKDLYRDIIKVLLGLVGGFGGGFAFKGYLDRDRE